MGVLVASLLAVTCAGALASERSEILTAKGEVAFHTGHPDEARRLLDEAVAADPNDAGAQYALGTVLNAAGAWDDAARAFERALALRPDLDEARQGLDQAHAHAEAAAGGESTSRPWGVHAMTGVGYDSNVKIAPGGQVLPGVGKKDDAAFIFGGGAYYNLLARPDALIRLEYDLYQTLHPDLSDYDFRSHRVRATLSYAVHPDVWIGVQGGYSHYTLGPHSYLGEPFVFPFLSLLEKEWGVTQLSYRYGDDTYLSSPRATPAGFHEVRDGPNNAVGIDQTLFFAGGRALSAGYLYGEENPSEPVGNDYQFHAHQGYVGVHLPLWWEVGLDLTYLYRRDDYAFPNSFISPRFARHDNEHHVSTALERPITSHVSAIIQYYATVNASNIDVFTYQRHVVSALLQVTY